MRKVYKKERDQIKDEIIQAFLPRAFIRRSSTFAAIAPKQGLILVNSASPKRAEDLLSTLREVIGTLPVRPLTVKMSPTATMTEWVTTARKPPTISLCWTSANCATPTKTAASCAASART
jgi:recombination associated protein RdgC